MCIESCGLEDPVERRFRRDVLTLICQSRDNLPDGQIAKLRRIGDGDDLLALDLREFVWRRCARTCTAIISNIGCAPPLHGALVDAEKLARLVLSAAGDLGIADPLQD